MWVIEWFINRLLSRPGNPCSMTASTGNQPPNPLSLVLIHAYASSLLFGIKSLKLLWIPRLMLTRSCKVSTELKACLTISAQHAPVAVGGEPQHAGLRFRAEFPMKKQRNYRFGNRPAFFFRHVIFRIHIGDSLLIFKL